MTAIDRAFIRAYELDEQDARPAAVVGPVDQMTVRAQPAMRRSDDAPTVEAATPREPHFRIYQEAAAASAPTPRPSGAGQRRPLSTFAQPTASVEARFRPAHEVDAFRWSPTVDELFYNHRAQWQTLVDTLVAADDAGRSLIGVAGAASGAGATTATACVARLLVEAGKSVAIVDADFADANLAAALGLIVEIGWEDVLAGRVPLAEAVVSQAANRLVLVPLVQGGVPAAEKLDGIHASVAAGVLRYHYDIVLFDLGAVADAVQGPIARRVARQCRLDGAVLVAGGHAGGATSPQRVMQSAPELAAVCLGIVENQLRAA